MAEFAKVRSFPASEHGAGSQDAAHGQGVLAADMPEKARGGIVEFAKEAKDDAWFDGQNGRCKVQVNCKRWMSSALLAAAAMAAMPRVLTAQSVNEGVAPTTRPANPTTRPAANTTQPISNLGPTTQPIIAAAPATRPAVSSTQVVTARSSENTPPTTQPVVAAAPTTRPVNGLGVTVTASSNGTVQTNRPVVVDGQVIGSQTTAAQTSAGQTTRPAETREEAAARDLRQQQETLMAAGATSAQREEAARRLVSRGSREADEALLKALGEFGNREVQIAVARGLASDTTPDPIFIEPLSNLLGSGSALTEAAAQAMVTYKGNEYVRERLANFARTPTNTLEARTGVIAAMGRLVDQKAAGSLINLLNTDTSSRIRETAAEALAEMTGMPRRVDAAVWNQWWSINEAKSEAEFSKDLLKQMAARRTELDKRLRQMSDAVDQNLRAQYRAATSDAEKTKVLNVYLQNPSEDMRRLGVLLIDYESTNFRAVPAAVFDQLRKMVGDSAATVRLEVAKTLGKAGEAGALEPLLTQLAQETDPRVRAEIIWALGPTHDMRAIEPLLNALTDPDTEIVRNAAYALSNLAPDLRKPQNEARAAQVAAELNRRMDETPAAVATEFVRTELAQALAALGHPSSRERLERLAGPNEPVESVRKWALRGLGLIGNRASAFFISPALTDPSRVVQIEAIRALKSCSDGFGGTANSLRARIGKEESDPEVRAAAWETLSVLFNQASEVELRLWKEHLKNDPDHSRRLRVLEELEERYAAAKADERLALTRQDLGAQHLLLNQPEKAVEKTKQALDYFDSFNAQEAITEPIVMQLMRARLRTKKYADAVDYALERLQREPKYLGEMWRVTKDQVDLLKKANDYNGALELITQFKRIELKTYAGPVQQVENEIKQLQSTGGRVWVRSPKAYEHVSRFPFHML